MSVVKTSATPHAAMEPAFPMNVDSVTRGRPNFIERRL